MLRQIKLPHVLLLVLLVSALAITNQSLWIDEGGAAIRALQPTPGEWWREMRLADNSDLQIVFQLGWLWAWAQVFGSSEVALRASNVPWLLTGVAAIWWGLRAQPALRLSVVLVLLSHAFVWYYLNEARPYIVLLAGSCLVFACLARAYLSPEEAVQDGCWLRVLYAGLFVMCATSIIAVSWAGCSFLAVGAMCGFRNLREVAWRAKFSSAVFVLALLGLAAYFAWTIHLGVRASSVGRTGLANLVFIFYEHLGMAGLGPGRLEIRDLGLRAFRPYAPFLLLMALALAVPIGPSLAILRKRMDARFVLAVAIAVLAPLLLTFTAGALSHMRLLGRHLTPLLPFLACGIALGLQPLFSGHQRSAAKAVTLASLLFLVISSFEIRWAFRHSKDDYRGAARLAERACKEGKTVWWVADRDTARYYGLPMAESPLMKLILVANPSREALELVAIPDVVALSKADVYDNQGGVRAFLESRGYRRSSTLQAFEIFERFNPPEIPVR